MLKHSTIKKLRLMGMLLLCCMASSFNAHAIIRTVSNDPAGGSQFATLLAAYNASVNGDTLMVEGTNIAYNMNADWAKSLVVIGAGINTQKQNFRRTIINSASSAGFACLVLQTASNGSKFYGIEFSGNHGGFFSVILQSPVSNVHFENCRLINGFSFQGLNSTNMSFRNCVFDGNNAININTGATVNLMSNILFTSCIFDGYIENQSNINTQYTFDQCLFLSTTTTIFSGLQFATIRNSIFTNIFPCCGATNSVFLNNLCRIAGSFPPSGAGNTGSGNISGVDPLFTTFTNGQMYSTAHDYTLQAGSPAIGTALGGGDIGLHGGGSGFSRFGEVLYTPVIRSMNIQNTSVSPNGTLNVDLNISKPANN